MKIAKKIKTLICDDVRQEAGGKTSLMGIYSKDIFVNNVPIILPIIHFVIMFEDIKEPFNTLFVTVVTPKSDPLQFSYPAPPDIEPGKDINIVIGLSPFRINDKGPARFEIRFSKQEKARIVHRFLIKAGDATT